MDIAIFFVLLFELVYMYYDWLMREAAGLCS